MPGLNLFTSNKLELLLEKLSSKSSIDHPVNPLTPEIIIVQSLGMARWLSIQMADKLGISANYSFPFPNKFIDDVFKIIIPEYSLSRYTDADTNIWQILKIIKEMRPENEFGSVRMYLEDDKDGLKAYQLSSHLANLFDQYAIFRPEMIIEWENHPPDNWQAVIWCELVKNSNYVHRTALFQKYFHIVQNGLLDSSRLPDQVALFGISSLPPVYIKIIESLSEFMTIDFYVLNPCREYWSDILSEKETARLSGKLTDREISEEDLHITRGNSLLASMGKQGRDFLYLLAEYSDSPDFEEPGEKTLIHTIQSDILNFRDYNSDTTPPREIASDDNSFQVHICHSEMRETEILHNKLLSFFENNSALMPRDIIVMAPNIEQYTPFIQAVFGNQENPKHRIPYTIADRGIKSESELIDTFFAILELTDSRYSLSEIKSILESEAIYPKFGLSFQDIEIITDWLNKAKVRWGKDADHKKSLELPEYPENTWKFGLDRLILGFAMPGDGNCLYNNILPYDNIEGEQASILGKFSEFIDRLFSHLEKIKTDKTLTEWVSSLIALCNDIFDSNNQTEHEIQTVRKKIQKLSAFQDYSNSELKVSIKVIKQYLKDQLSKHDSTSGFIAGSVTFCAILPMRSIPFKVICLLGMNNTAFPRQAKHYSFDLIANKPRIGDRSSRHTDRYLFLEALLSAREKLYLSYIGQGITDNNTIPPSVLVSELLDYIRSNFVVDSKPVDNHILTYHKLQAFSHEYFSGSSKLSSYSSEIFQASIARLNSPNIFPEFFASKLPELEENDRTIDINNLCRFFSNPSKYLLNNRLGIYLDQFEVGPEDEEPYTLNGLIRYKLANDILESCLQGEDIKDRLQLARADGILPHGTLGDISFNNLAADIIPIAKNVEPLIRDSMLKPLKINLTIGNFVINGTLENIYQSGLVSYKAGKVSEKDILVSWIKFLVLCSDDNHNYPSRAVLLGADKNISFNKIENPEIILEDLIDLYHLGMCKPLLFFPKTSYKFAFSIFTKKTVEQAIKSAVGVWSGSDYNRGEGEDPYHMHCFRRISLADQDFRDIAGKIYMPIFNTMDRH